MKVSTTTVLDILSRLRNTFLSDSTIRRYDEEPFRSELFSAEQMDRHGASLARAHKLQQGQSSLQLLRRLEDNE
ncbi:MAG: hypothetical protein WKF70_02135, partial [Chitinophagaceae bacterium]